MPTHLTKYAGGMIVNCGPGVYGMVVDDSELNWENVCWFNDPDEDVDEDDLEFVYVIMFTADYTCAAFKVLCEDAIPVGRIHSVEDLPL